MGLFVHRIRIKKVLWWGGNCPFQVEAVCEDERPLYLRSRHSGLTVDLGEPGERDAVMQGIVFHITHPEDDFEWGWVNMRDVYLLTRGYIRWPITFALRSLWEGNFLVRYWRGWRMARNIKRFCKDPNKAKKQ